MQRYAAIVLVLFGFISANALADNPAPWGRATLTPTEYKPQKVVYDVTTGELGILSHVLDRASHLSTITGADPFDQSIVLVIHGSAIKFFAIENTDKYKAMLARAESLVSSEVIKIRICKIAAEALGYKPQDLHGFVEVVPMGDAEIVRLQYEEGYAYMQ